MGDVGWSRLFSALVQASHETSWPLCVICVYGNDKVCKPMCMCIYICMYVYIYTWVIVNVTMKPPVMHGYFIGDQWLLVSGSSTIWPYMTICHYILFPPQTYQRLSLYNALPIFLGGWQHQPDLYDLEFLWISTHDCFKIWVNYDKPWSMDDWTKQKISAESVFSCQNLTIWPWKVFPYPFCSGFRWPSHGYTIIIIVMSTAPNMEPT